MGNQQRLENVEHDDRRQELTLGLKTEEKESPWRAEVMGDLLLTRS